MTRWFNFSYGDIEIHAKQKQGRRWFKATIQGQCAFGYSSDTSMEWLTELKAFCGRVLMFNCVGRQLLLKRLRTL